MAEKQLRALQDALQKALADNASDEEVQKLMDELQQAMDRYVDALKEKMDREPRGPRSRPQMNSNTVEMRREDLQKMLERARDMAKAGNRDAARELLAQMQQMLESLQTQQTAGQMSEDMEKAMQMLEDMDQLMDKQQELMDQTFRDSQQQQEGDQPMQGAAQRKQQQEALRDATGQMMRDYADMFGEVPPSLGRAESNMRESSKALGEGRPQDALQPQSQALTELQQAMQEMTNAMAQALQGQQGQDPRNQTGLGDDPLNRDGNGMDDLLGNVEIPDQPDMQRAQEILEELRRRASERSRPKLEREYIDRLLKQF